MSQFFSLRRGLLSRCALLFAALVGSESSVLAVSTTFSAATPGNSATLPTSFGDSVFLASPGINVNPAFKVEDSQANWAKDDDGTNAYSPSADRPPLIVADVPLVVFQGSLYIGLGIDFNETGTTSDYDVVNIELWTGPQTSNTMNVATVSDPNISQFAWNGAKGSDVSLWERSVRVMDSNTASNNALGINQIYEQNITPQIFTAGDTKPYDTDPQRVVATNLTTLGSNQVDLAVLIPASVLEGVPLDHKFYWGFQSGVDADGGSDRFGIMDPTSIVAGGFFDTQGVTFTTPEQAGIPEPRVLSLIALAGLLVSRRRRRQS
jgi:hypothetical protein